MLQHHITVSADGVLRTLGDQFTSPQTFALELIQNARRAGANPILVDLDRDRRIVTITDYGSGMRSLDEWFCVGKSGWDEETCAAENPFGIGAAASLYAADEIELRSGPRCARFSTADALAGGPIIEDDQCQNFPGTRIRLWLPQTTLFCYDDLANACKGFPVEVIIDGRAVDRSDARSRWPMRPFEYGEFHVPPLTPDTWTGLSIDAYLQGLPITIIDRVMPTDSRRCLVHLDSQKVRARVPDRDQLATGTSGHAVERALLRAIDAQAREELTTYKATVAPDVFADTWGMCCLRFHASDLLLDGPLPNSVLQVYSDLPHDTGYDARAAGPWDGDALPVLFRNADGLDASVEDSGAMLMACYLHINGIPYIERRDAEVLGAHPVVRDALDAEQFVASIVDVRGVYAEFDFGTSVIDIQVVLCDSFRLQVREANSDEADPRLPDTLVDTPLFDYDANVLYVPGGRNADVFVDSNVLRQASNYLDNSVMQWDELDKDGMAINARVLAAQAGDYACLITDQLNDLPWRLLKGQVFTVSFDPESGAPVVKAVA